MVSYWLNMKKASAKNSKLVLMFVYFDDTAWLPLNRQNSAIVLLLKARESCSLRIAVSVENLREPVIKESVGKEGRVRNLIALVSLRGDLKFDDLLVFDHSRLGLANCQLTMLGEFSIRV